MTEREWNVCTDPARMLAILEGRQYSRKRRLFACACCRRIWNLLADERSRHAVAVSEQYADKEATKAALLVAQEHAMLGNDRFDEYVYPAENAAASVCRPTISPRWIAQLATWAVGNRAVWARPGAARAVRHEATDNESIAQAELLRCIFGHIPFRAPVLPASLTQTVIGIARTMYDERAFDRLPVLADALEEAGCSHPDILNHCRQGGVHVRGCWVVDLILGKA